MVQVPAAYAGSSFSSPAPQVHTSGEGKLFLGANPPLLRQSSTKLLDSPVQVIDFEADVHVGLPTEQGRIK